MLVVNFCSLVIIIRDLFLTRFKILAEVLKEYAQGDLIFQEGDLSKAAYLIVKGQIELTKKGFAEPFAVMSGGELIGEIGIIDGKPYNCSAVAKGKVILEEFSRERLKKLMENDQDFALTVIKNLVKIIRETDHKLIAKQLSNIMPIDSPVSHKASKLAKIKDFPVPAVSQKNQPEVQLFNIKTNKSLFNWIFNQKSSGIINLYLPPVKGSSDNQIREQLIIFLETIKGCQAHSLGKTAQDENLTALLFKREGDLLINCEINSEQNVVVLSFITPKANFNTYGIMLHNFFKFYLPIKADEKKFNLLKTIILGMIVAGNEIQGDLISKSLLTLIKETKDLGLTTYNFLSSSSNAHNLICFGISSFNLYDLTKDYQWLNLAVMAFKKALIIEQNHQELIFIANLLLAQAFTKPVPKDGLQDNNMAIAVNHYKQAKKALHLSKDAEKIAIIESQISFISSALGMVNGKEDELLDAIESAQAALKYFSLAKDLTKWSVIANNMAQTMQFYGNLYKNVKYINDSIETFNTILKTRDQKQMPLSWAETKNNLASSYFLLGKYTNGNEHFQKAADFFEEATIIYKTHKQEKKANISLRNHNLAMRACETTFDKALDRNVRWRLELEKSDEPKENLINSNDEEWQKEILSLNS